MAPTTGERIARVEEQVVNLVKVIEDHHVELTNQIEKLAERVENGHLTNYRVAEIEDKVRKIAGDMQAKLEKAEELKQSAIMDRGRIEELKNLYNMVVAAEEKPVPEMKAPTKRRAKK